MVRQIPSTEIATEALKNHCSYYGWLCELSGLSGPLAQLFYETDFRWSDGIEDDENRAKNAKDLREQYAIFVLRGDDATGIISTEQWRDIDLLKKSILGPACVFEVLVFLARELDSMLNMEAESQVQKYFSVMMSNAGFDVKDDEDWDGNAEKTESYWKEVLDRVLDRKYEASGKGGLFPLNDDESSGFDQRKRPLWSQLNDWADQEMEASEEDGWD